VRPGYSGAGFIVSAGYCRVFCPAGQAFSNPSGYCSQRTAMSLLQVTDLHKAYGDFMAVRGVDFSLDQGEMLALIGPNGAGKSTTFNMIGGQTRANQGTVCLNGQSILGMQARDIWQLGVGRTFQIAATFASLTVVENVQMTL